MGKVTHGMKGTRIYRIWQLMKNRCGNPKCDRYMDYGGRGIVVCDEWRNNFINFYEWSMINGYADNLSIDRINNDEGYEPSNCRWASITTQHRNKRTNHYLTYDGKKRCISEWSEITGLTEACIRNRLRYGWNVEDTLTKPRGYGQGHPKSRRVGW